MLLQHAAAGPDVAAGPDAGCMSHLLLVGVRSMHVCVEREFVVCAALCMLLRARLDTVHASDKLSL